MGQKKIKIDIGRELSRQAVYEIRSFLIALEGYRDRGKSDFLLKTSFEFLRLAVMLAAGEKQKLDVYMEIGCLFLLPNREQRLSPFLSIGITPETAEEIYDLL